MRTVRFYTLVTLPVGVVAIVVTAKVFSLLWKCSNRQILIRSVSSQQLRTVPLVEIQTIYIIITILSRTTCTTSFHFSCSDDWRYASVMWWTKEKVKWLLYFKNVTEEQKM